MGELIFNFNFFTFEDLFVQKICKSKASVKTLKLGFAVQKRRSFQHQYQKIQQY